MVSWATHLNDSSLCNTPKQPQEHLSVSIAQQMITLLTCSISLKLLKVRKYFLLELLHSPVYLSSRSSGTVSGILENIFPGVFLFVDGRNFSGVNPGCDYEGPSMLLSDAGAFGSCCNGNQSGWIFCSGSSPLKDDAHCPECTISRRLTRGFPPRQTFIMTVFSRSFAVLFTRQGSHTAQKWFL